MEDFTQILEEIEKSLDVEVSTNYVCYAYNNYNRSFKNASKLPINQIHLERLVHVKIKDPPEDVDIDRLSPKELSKFYEKRKEIIPALHKSWIPQRIMIHEYQPYYFTADSEKNALFIEKNQKFIGMLMYLLELRFHEFWCTVLFEPSIAKALSSLLLNPIAPYEVGQLTGEYLSTYEAVFSCFLWVYERLISFQCSNEEYMHEKFGLKCLLDCKLISLPIIVTLSLLYKNHNRSFINRISGLYFSDDSHKLFREKEIEEKINHTKMVFEMIERLVCRNKQLGDVVPISIDPRPANFSLTWLYSVVNYLLHTVTTLNTLFEIHKAAVEMAHDLEVPSRLCFTYDTVYSEVYDMLDEREDIHNDPELANVIFDQIATGRAEFLNAYNAFVSYCLDKAVASQNNTTIQEDYVESYLKLMNIALENECFICDYHVKFNVDVTNEMFANYCAIDVTRTDYIMKCIDNLPRSHKLSEIIKQRQTVEQSFRDNAPRRPEPILQFGRVEVNGVANSSGPSEQEIDQMIKDIIDMFPHLGDGFVLQCLEAYDYKSSEVINAILEENLPPHIVDVPFDLIRIPPEPEPPKPVLAYRGKRPDDYDDAIKLLDDKKAKEEMKTYVLEGIKYGSDYDPYDDDYDDREDEAPIPMHLADNGVDEISRFNPNYADEALASDTSYSEEEYDDDGKPVGISNGAGPGPSSRGYQQNDRSKNFCEDPAVLRARREAAYRGRGRGRGGGGSKNSNVVGKPKGQGQDKNTQHSRQVKSANKSSRANHNRKGGAQFKRNRGMVPS